MNFKEFLNEQATKTKKHRTQIKVDSKQAIIHLIKAFKYNDPYNYEKHLRDVDTFLKRIVRNSLLGDLKLKDYRDNFFRDETEFNELFSQAGKNYTVPIKDTDENVKIRIKEILEQLSKDLYNKEFKTIKEYIEK